MYVNVGKVIYSYLGWKLVDKVNGKMYKSKSSRTLYYYEIAKPTSLLKTSRRRGSVHIPDTYSDREKIADLEYRVGQLEGHLGHNKKDRADKAKAALATMRYKPGDSDDYETKQSLSRKR